MATITKRQYWLINDKRFWSASSAKAAAKSSGVRMPRAISAGWRAQVRVEGCRAESRTFDAKSAAERWALERERDLRRTPGSIDPNAARKVSMRAVLETYETDRARYLPSYANSEKWRIPALITRVGGDAVSAMTVRRLVDYANARRDDGLSDDTIIREFNVLSAALNHAVLTGLTPPAWRSDQHPVVVAKRALRLRAGPGRKRRLNANEWQRVLEAAGNYGDGMALHLMLFAADTPLRRSELVGMSWSRIDLDRRSVYVPDSKNSDSRVVWLTAVAAEALSAVGELRGRIDGVWGLQPRSMSQVIERVREKAGVSDWRLHDLRHEGATRLLELGLGESEVQMQTGHKTLAMLARYVHLASSRVGKRIKDLEAANVA